MKRPGNRLSYLVLFSLFLAIVYFAYHFSHITLEDHKKWSLLLEAISSHEEEEKMTEQKRTKVSKEIYLSGENGIRYLRIDTEESKLTLLFKGEGTAVRETFERNIALIQDKCYYVDEEGKEIGEESGGFPQQSIRILRSENASVDYKEKTLHADEIEIYSYSLPGHSPPTHISGQPYMRAKGKNLSIFFNEEDSHLCCHQVIALFGQERYITAPLMSYFPKEDLMLFEGNQEEAVIIYDILQKRCITTRQLEGRALQSPGKESWRAAEGVQLLLQEDLLEKIKSQFSCHY